MENEKTKKVQAVKKPKKKGPGKVPKRPRGSGGINLGMFENTPGDNTNITLTSIEIFNLPKIDLTDADAVEKRLSECLEIFARHDLKPTISGVAMGLGLNRQDLWAMAYDQPTTFNLPTATTDLIKKLYKFMEALWEANFSSGKLNPVTGIFLGKNQFNYQDKVEHVITPNHVESEVDEDFIRQRYLTDSGDVVDSPDFEVSDSDN